MSVASDADAVLAAYNEAYEAANRVPLIERRQRMVYHKGWFELRSTRSSWVMARYRRKEIEAMTAELRSRVPTPTSAEHGAEA